MTDLKTMLNEGEEDNLKLSAKCNRRAGYLACLHDVVDFIVFGDNVSDELKYEIMPFLHEKYIKAVIATKNDDERVKELENNIVDIEKEFGRTLKISENEEPKLAIKDAWLYDGSGPMKCSRCGYESCGPISDIYCPECGVRLWGVRTI